MAAIMTETTHLTQPWLVAPDRSSAGFPQASMSTLCAVCNLVCCLLTGLMSGHLLSDINTSLFKRAASIDTITLHFTTVADPYI